MKKLIFATTFSFLFNLGAAHADRILAQVTEVDATVKLVNLTETGLVEVIKRDESRATMQLSPSNARRLVADAISLIGAKLTTRHRPVTCKVILPAFSFHDLLVINQSGNLILTLTSSSCALTDYIHPTLPVFVTKAVRLENELLLLAHQVAGN